MEKLNITEICFMIKAQLEDTNPDCDRIDYWVGRLRAAQEEFKRYLAMHAEAEQNSPHDSRDPKIPMRYS